MRILYVSQFFPPEPGASAGRAYEQAKYWTRANHQVTVLTGFPTYPAGVLPPRFRWRMMVRECLEGIGVLRTWHYATRNEGFLRRIAAFSSFFLSSLILGALFFGHCDVIIGTSPQLLAAFSAYLLSRIKRVPFVLEIRDLWPAVLVELGIFKNRRIIRLLEGIESLLYRKAARIVVVTEAFKEAIIKKGIEPSKIEVIPNGADPELFQRKPNGKVREKLHINGEFLVTYLGNLGVSQNLSSVLEAASLLKREKDICFLFVGDGTERDKLLEIKEERGLDNALFVPVQPKEKVPEYYNASDVCLVPLRSLPIFKSFVPSKLFEIMGAGKPIIGSVYGESRQILSRSGAAILVDPDDSRSLAQAVLTLKNDPERRKQMAVSAHRFVFQNYNRETLASRYAAFLRTVLQEAPIPEIFMKRALDVVLSLLALAVTSPLWVLIPLAIWLEDRRPIFYAQERVGKGGRIFDILKFRSMVADAEEEGPLQASRGDSRITRVGKILRKTALDELPQVLNILKGDMSFVGPRAVRPPEFETPWNEEMDGVDMTEIPGYSERHKIRPGLTGIAQLYAARDVDHRYRFKYDLIYLRNRSILLDFRLILSSVWMTLRGRWGV
ncbi:MAG: sugar transferase [Armatimonadetes bacterium]|nr:sugar transferase [Armatimonadota bacterium]